jgi:hypothetical protein
VAIIMVESAIGHKENKKVKYITLKLCFVFTMSRNNEVAYRTLEHKHIYTHS